MKPDLLIIACLSILYGCDRGGGDGPPQVAYGRDECAQCGMIVSEERHAAAVRATVDGQVKDIAFDDIGDMLAYEREHGAAITVTRRFVHDFESRQWIDANTAHYVASETLHTPMGSGIIAFAEESAARRKSEETKGRLITFTNLRELTGEDPTATKSCCTKESD